MNVSVEFRIEFGERVSLRRAECIDVANIDDAAIALAYCRKACLPVEQPSAEGQPA